MRGSNRTPSAPHYRAHAPARSWSLLLLVSLGVVSQFLVASAAGQQNTFVANPQNAEPQRAAPGAEPAPAPEQKSDIPAGDLLSFGQEKVAAEMTEL
ncbi:MAG: hypothetical protein JNG90_14645, partial [Planctomycetaceae bacterium]|nr:hypothetical protein [Planctomycetaceae bacterium]